MKQSKSPLVRLEGQTVSLSSPTAMPLASAFLWNPSMMLQINCRGYATAQFMQPEPAKYAHAPNLEAKTFMQPEQPYYAHHPGRFFYVKDLDSKELFSAPFEPVRSQPRSFDFSVSGDCISWLVVQNDIELKICVTLSPDRPLELWEVQIKNVANVDKRLSLTPYFPVGYMSWMNQSANYDESLQAIVCKSITPYQQYSDYFKNRDLKDLTFLLAERSPDSYCARQSAFEGDGGLHNPDALSTANLGNEEASYETPTCAMQYSLSLKPGQHEQLRFAFGPAKNLEEIEAINAALFTENDGFSRASKEYQNYINRSRSPLSIETPDKELDNFVNHWLPRQVYYHGDVNRLSTDPQTRNYLQDNMGMAYVSPERARSAFIRALSQQSTNGAMPDGVLLSEQAELKYINQIPHMDHCVWLPICIDAYLQETNDFEFLENTIGFADSDEQTTVAEHIHRAMRWLFNQRDDRGLTFIAQGDWCDPMNMVGHKGKGVSGWLTLATAYACKVWSSICHAQNLPDLTAEFQAMNNACNAAVNKHLWDGDWYGRGITDDGKLFGIADDSEGKIYLNPQSWAMLSGAASSSREAAMIAAIDLHLVTPFGVEMLSPAYTGMREDVGRLTQKHPGSAENGSVYNHAAAFYSYALYQQGHADRAYDVIRKMLPNNESDDLEKRGQLPVFIPNYYRGAYRQFKRTAGRSSQLFNTGTVHWFMRCLIDGLFGVAGTKDGLKISPNMPTNWPSAKLTRFFRGSEFNIDITRNSDVQQARIHVNDVLLSGALIKNIEPGCHYDVKVELPNGG